MRRPGGSVIERLRVMTRAGRSCEALEEFADDWVVLEVGTLSPRVSRELGDRCDLIVANPQREASSARNRSRSGACGAEALERISQPPQQDADAGELSKAEEVRGFALVAGDEATGSKHPGEQPLDAPTSAVASQRSTVLCLALPRGIVRRDHLDPLLGELLIESITVVGAVSDQALWEFSGEPLPERVMDEACFMSLTTSNPNGDRKATAVCHCHDLGRFAAASSPNDKAPLFAPAWEPSMYASVRSSFPRSRRSSAKARRIFRRMLLSTQAWYRRWHVWYGGYRAGRSAQGAPVRKIHSTPFITSRGDRQGRPPLRPGSFRSRAGIKASIACHCSSVKSMDARVHRPTSISSQGCFPLTVAGLALSPVPRLWDAF
jgi:hypothetical protein